MSQPSSTPFTRHVVRSFVFSLVLLAFTRSPMTAQTVVWAWGDNYFGQLGNGLVNHETLPVQALHLTSVTQVSGGFRYSVALKKDGTVWVWGDNSSSQLGDGTIFNRNTPYQIASLKNITAVAAGGLHCLALDSAGKVWAWGYNYDGEIGDGTRNNRSTPVQITTLPAVQSIAAGAFHSLALDKNGRVWSWGYNNVGQLGDGTLKSRWKPVQLTTLPLIQAIAGKGDGHSVALDTTGTVWCWGSNNSGQVGDGTYVTRTSPVQVKNLANITAIASGGSHSLALSKDSTVWAWGDNTLGQLGDGTKKNNSSTPVQAISLTGVRSIAARGGHNLALDKNDIVWAWGDNGFGEVGDGTIINRFKPLQVTGLPGIGAIECGAGHSVAVTKADGFVVAWGNNDVGQLGEGIFGSSNVPLGSNGSVDIQSLGCGDGHSLAATKSDGTVWDWGSNNAGQLGDGTYVTRTAAVPVKTLTGISAVAGGNLCSIALDKKGAVWAWGYNNVGQLGDGTNNTRIKPVQVKNLSGVSAIACGGAYGVALCNGKVFAWGYNSVGQLGDGTNNNSTVPVRVSGLTGIAVIASGGGQSLAVRQSDGTVWAWGYNSDGQLGDGTTINRNTPILVSGLTNVVRVAAGAKHSLALKADGTVWAWGHNYDGEIGDGTTTNRLKPVPITGLSNVVAIAAGAWHSLALKSDGTVWAWGYNYDGELGNETNVNRWKPVLVNGLTHIAQIAAHGNHNLALENDSVATTLSVQAGAAAIGTKVTFMATLTRADSHALLSGENVLFALDGIPIGPHLTNSNGVAAVSYSIPESLLPGSHSLVADFSGDSSFGASQGKLLLTVAKGAVTITVPDVTGSAGSKVTLQATLKNSVATGLAQRTLKFIVNGVSVGSAATNANGQASLIYTIPTGTSAGKQTVQATFSGGSLYKDGTGTGKLTIQ